MTFCQFIQCSRMYIDWTRQHRTKNEERTSQYRMFKVGTECPGVYQSPSRTLDAGCVSRLAMLTVLRAAGGWSLVISPPDPRHPHPSTSRRYVTVILGSGSGQLMASPSPALHTPPGHRTPNLAPLPRSQSLVLYTRAGNEPSRRFHNHRSILD